MSCNRRVDDLMARMLTGEINPLAAALLRRHLRRCPQCRAEYEKSRELWTDLGHAAWQPAEDDLKKRISAALPDPYESARRVRNVEAQQVRMKLVLAGVLVLVLATALMAAEYISGGGGGGGSTGGNSGGSSGGSFGGGSGGQMSYHGRVWNWTFTWQGTAKIIVDDKVRCVMSPGPSNGSPGSVNVTVEGDSFHFDKPGKHEVRDPKSSELFGYIDMRAGGSSQGSHQPGSHASSGVKTTQDGCEGFDKSLGLTWQLKGSANVTVKDADGNLRGGGRCCPGNAPREPDLAVQVNGKQAQFHGYGTFNVPDANGKPLLTFIVESFSPPNMN